MVRDPDIDMFVYTTHAQERYESRHRAEEVLFRQESSLSALSRARIRGDVEIPDCLEHGRFGLSVLKRYLPYSQLVESKIQE